MDDRGREGCENPGIECDCAVAAVEALLAAIDAPPAPHPFAALLRDDAALVAVSRGLGPMTHAARARALLLLGAESDLYEGTPQPGHREGCAMAGWPFEVSPCGCGPGAEAPAICAAQERLAYGLGAVCTEAPRHEGDHVAADETGREVSRWATEPEAGKEGASE